MRLEMFKRVFIDLCNICYIDTENPTDYPECTKMYCGKPFDRIYYENEMEYVENFGWKPIDFNIWIIYGS